MCLAAPTHTRCARIQRVPILIAAVFVPRCATLCYSMFGASLPCWVRLPYSAWLAQARRHAMQLMLRVQHARHYINNKRAAKGLPYHHR